MGVETEYSEERSGVGLGVTVGFTAGEETELVESEYSLSNEGWLSTTSLVA